MKPYLALLCIFPFLMQPLYGQGGSLVIENLRCEYRVDPLGIDFEQPRLSWELASVKRSAVQSAYRIVIASCEKTLANGNGDIWDSGKVFSSNTNQLEYGGPALSPRTYYYWKVMVWDGEGRPSPWSEAALWSMGLLEFADAHAAQWIEYPVGVNTTHKYEELYLPPARYLRTEFPADKKVVKATAYASSKGIYELHLNGRKVGDDFFTPGWTDYNKRIYYNTYDVTALVKEGPNAVGAIVADGWYSGYVGFGILEKLERVREFYGVEPALYCRLDIEYEDGTTSTVTTHPGWRASTGSILEADILMGEYYDARLEQRGWDMPGFDDSTWPTASISNRPEGRLEAYPGQPVLISGELMPVSISDRGEGTYIFDMGKNYAGNVRLHIAGHGGTKITLRYGEMLHADGSLMTENLRTARATDYYIPASDEPSQWMPRFTYHGFRYVEISGLKEPPTAEMITGVVMNSPTPVIGTFRCSNVMNNTLFDNIVTTQLANFFDIPTDCPQRDERLAWTGDAQIYARSACYVADAAAFYTKWLVDLDDSRRTYGPYPSYAPYPYAIPQEYSTGWMDAGVIIPYTVYKMYGDLRVIEKAYEGMRDFMRWQQETSAGYLRSSGPAFGDWLCLGRQVSNDLVASAYYGYDAMLMAEMAGAIGRTDDAQEYSALYENIRTAFAARYISPDGSIPDDDTDTAYALALCFGLYPEALAQSGADRLAASVKANGNRISAGFLGTKHVMLALARYGHSDLAYELFRQTAYPSWGYSVVNGATSIWERWDSYTLENGFDGENGQNNAVMNSFSHYSFGSVAEWIYRYAAGIECDGAGFRRITLRPSVDPGMSRLEASYKSINGLIASGWEKLGGTIRYTFTIPANTTALVTLPATSHGDITENGTVLDKVEGVSAISSDGRTVMFTAGSGTYVFDVAEAKGKKR